MSAVFDPAQVTVLMPVGGRATRSLEVTRDVIPKHLIKLDNGLPILEVVLQQLQIVGFRKFVFCTGHHQDQISNFVGGETWVTYEDVSYRVSVESRPLGPEGAILAAINDLGITGQAMFVTGDNLVPWDGLVMMNEIHTNRGATATAGLTSVVTERTTDVGKIIMDAENGRIIRVFSRTEDSWCHDGELALTSCGLTVVSIGPYLDLCRQYVSSREPGDQRPFGLRDDILPWAMRTGRSDIYGHDLRGEILDLGTPDNIRYGQQNWSDYVLN